MLHSDKAEKALEAELGELNESIVELRERKDEVTDEIDLLKRMKSELEADCNAKNKVTSFMYEFTLHCVCMGDLDRWGRQG